VEGLDIVDAIVIGLEHTAQVTPWPLAFPLAQATIDPLVDRFRQNDFGIFVCSPDDDLTMRDGSYKVSRDNVLFEAGLFMGIREKHRTFIVTPRDPDFHLPTDFLGITVAQYDPNWARKDAPAALATAVAKIRLAISRTMWDTRSLHVETLPVVLGPPTLKYPLKIHVRITNKQDERVLVKLNGFKFSKLVRLHPDAPRRWDNLYDFLFYLGKVPLARKSMKVRVL